MIDYAIILSTHYAGKQWTLHGDSYDGLTWYDESAKPTQEELDALWETTKTVYVGSQQAAEKAKASALAKLTKLGLTADEITALTGN